MTAARRRGTNDEGASLIIVLAFIALFGVWVGATLSFSGSVLKGNQRIQEQAVLSYAADAAAEIAIETVRGSSYNNEVGEGSNCFGGAPDLQVPSIDGSGAMVVHCDADGTTGGTGTGVPINPSNKPGQAILTLSQNAGEDGIYLDSNNDVRVRGKIISNSTIRVQGSSALVDENATIRARGVCTPTPSTPNAVTDRIRGVGDATTPGALCNTGVVTARPTGAAYAQPSGPLVARNVPTYSCTAGTVVRLDPGFYRDAAALSDLGSCPVTVVLKPGDFYFDFTVGTSRVWTVTNPAALVVAGTPTWNDATSSRPPVVSVVGNKNVYVPGACKTPLDSVANGGTRMVFGGDSQFSLSGGQVELCGKYFSSAPPITIFGATSQVGTNTEVTAAGLQMVAGSGAVTPSPAPTFLNPNNIVPNDTDAVASATALSANATATVTVDGFVPSTPVPAGSTLNSAVLTVRYRTDPSVSGSGKVTSTAVSVTPNGGAPTADLTVPANESATTLASRTVNLTTALADVVQAQGWNGGKITLKANENNKAGGGAHIESLVLDLKYIAPFMRAQSGCVSTAPYVPNSSNCAFLKSLGNQSYLYVQGTTFAPDAAVDLQVANSSGQVFRSGIISRVLRIQLPAASTTEAVIQVPEDATGGTNPVSTYFTVYQCPGASTCTTTDPNAIKRLRTRVTFSIPSVNRTAAVEWWRVLR